jgi:hypothetical protein
MLKWINYTNQHPKRRQIKEEPLKTGILGMIAPKEHSQYPKNQFSTAANPPKQVYPPKMILRPKISIIMLWMINHTTKRVSCGQIE